MSRNVDQGPDLVERPENISIRYRSRVGKVVENFILGWRAEVGLARLSLEGSNPFMFGNLRCVVCSQFIRDPVSLVLDLCLLMLKREIVGNGLPISRFYFCCRFAIAQKSFIVGGSDRAIRRRHIVFEAGKHISRFPLVPSNGCQLSMDGGPGSKSICHLFGIRNLLPPSFSGIGII